MSTYLVGLRDKASFEVEADFYGQDGGDFIFSVNGREVWRVPMFDVSSISKVK